MSRSAAAKWRANNGSRACGERAHRQEIFQGLEDIDNMIAAEHIRPHSAPSQEQAPNLVSNVGVKRQLTASQRMHHGQHSAGDQTDDLAEQVHQLTACPQVVAPAGRPSSQMASRAHKFRRVSEPCPTNQGSLQTMPDVARPASSQSSRSSSTRPGSRNSERRRFHDHHELFATVLTPRSRSTRAKVKRPQFLSIDSMESNLRSVSPLGTPIPSSTVHSRASSRRSSRTPEPTTPPRSVSPRSQMGPLEKEKCLKTLRLLIFVQNKNATDRDKLRVFQEEIGTAKQAKEFFQFWIHADPQLRGSAEYNDFRDALHHLESSVHVHKLQSMKITTLLINRRSGLVTVNEVAEAIWPDITSAQIAEIWQHCEIEQEKSTRRVGVAEPPVLPEDERIALERVFSDIDAGKTGYVSFEALVAARDIVDLPIIDDVDRLKRCMAEWGCSDSEFITLEQFLLLMCPAGLRAVESSDVVTMESGTVITRSDTGRWYTEDDEHVHQGVLEPFRRSVRRFLHAKRMAA